MDLYGQSLSKFIRRICDLTIVARTLYHCATQPLHISVTQTQHKVRHLQEYREDGEVLVVADGRRDTEYRLQEERRDADEQQEVVQLGDGLGVDVEARDLAVGERRDARQQHQQRQLRHGVH